MIASTRPVHGYSQGVFQNSPSRSEKEMQDIPHSINLDRQFLLECVWAGLHDKDGTKSYDEIEADYSFKETYEKRSLDNNHWCDWTFIKNHDPLLVRIGKITLGLITLGGAQLLTLMLDRYDQGKYESICKDGMSILFDERKKAIITDCQFTAAYEILKIHGDESSKPLVSQLTELEKGCQAFDRFVVFMKGINSVPKQRNPAERLRVYAFLSRAVLEHAIRRSLEQFLHKDLELFDIETSAVDLDGETLEIKAKQVIKRWVPNRYQYSSDVMTVDITIDPIKLCGKVMFKEASDEDGSDHL